MRIEIIRAPVYIIHCPSGIDTTRFTEVMNNHADLHQLLTLNESTYVAIFGYDKTQVWTEDERIQFCFKAVNLACKLEEK